MIDISILDKDTMYKLETYVKSKFIPESSQNNGGDFISFTCNNVTISLERLSSYLWIKLPNTGEIFEISIDHKSTFKTLWYDAKGYHIRAWNNDQTSRAKSIIENLT